MVKSRVKMGVDADFDAFIREESERLDLNFREVTKKLADNKFQIRELLGK